MKLRKGEIISICLVASYFLAAWLLLPHMPEKMASHWGIDGQANGFMPKGPALFAFPCVTTLVLGMFLLITRIDPKGRVREFTGIFDTFQVLFLLFMGYVFGLMIAWNFGVRFDFSVAMAPGFAGLIYLMGVLTEGAKPNYFIGIRTPWTLESPEVWEKTHALGGWLFKLCAAIALFGLLFPKYVMAFVIGPLMVVPVYLMYYSYKEFQKIKKS